MDKIAVVSMQRNESKYILEWLAYYLVQGVDRFIIYNHQSIDDTAEIYTQLSKHLDITLYTMTGHNVHYPMLEHALTNHKDETDWLIFADMDEFYFPTEANSIREVLSQYRDITASAIGVYWCAFGSSGLVQDPDLVLPSYVNRGELNISTNHHMKSIVRGRHSGWVRGTNPHVFTTQYGTVDLQGHTIPPYAGHNIDATPVHAPMRINHYQCKSWEYFKTVKQVRGSTADRPPGAPGAEIPDSVFHEYDYNDVPDDAIWRRFGEPVLNKIEELKRLLHEPTSDNT